MKIPPAPFAFERRKMEKGLRLRVIGDPVEANKVLRSDAVAYGQTLMIDNAERGLELADENPDLFMLDADSDE